MIDLDHTLVKAMEKKILHGFAQYRIPDHIQDGIQAYILDGRPTGDFLAAVFADELVGSFKRADSINIRAMTDIVTFMYLVAPMGCRGSKAIVDEWIKAGGMRGQFNTPGQL